MAIQVGDKVPACTMKTMGAEGPADISTDDIFAGNRVPSPPDVR
jgi:peroxiredoxin